jgi:hypothetical protein
VRIIHCVLDRCLPTRHNFLSSSSRQMTQVPRDSSPHIHRRQNLRCLFVFSFRLLLPILSHLSWSDVFLYNSLLRLQKHESVSVWSFFLYFLVFVLCIFSIFLCCSSAYSFLCSFSSFHLPLMNLSLSLIFCSLFCYFIFAISFFLPLIVFVFLHLSSYVYVAVSNAFAGCDRAKETFERSLH